MFRAARPFIPLQIKEVGGKPGERAAGLYRYRRRDASARV